MTIQEEIDKLIQTLVKVPSVIKSRQETGSRKTIVPSVSGKSRARQVIVPTFSDVETQASRAARQNAQRLNASIQEQISKLKKQPQVLTGNIKSMLDKPTIFPKLAGPAANPPETIPPPSWNNRERLNNLSKRSFSSNRSCFTWLNLSEIKR